MSLEAAIPAAVVDLRKEWALLAECENIHWRDVVLNARPAGGMHQSTRIAVAGIGNLDDRAATLVEEWNLYVDGSSSAGSAGWGMAVLARMGFTWLLRWMCVGRHRWEQ